MNIMRIIDYFEFNKSIRNTFLPFDLPLIGDEEIQEVIDITSIFNIKMEALKCHKSHVEMFGNDFLESIEARASYSGYEIQSRYAESFEVIRAVNEL